MSSCRIAAGSMYHHYPINFAKILLHVNMDKILRVHDCKLDRQKSCSMRT